MVKAVTLRLPAWALRTLCGKRAFPTDRDKMAAAVALARASLGKGGGPFGAAVFESDGGKLVSVGVNLVLASGCSAAHAEIVALSLAQAAVGAHRLDARGRARYTLASSSQPCSMCFGALAWSGVGTVLCGARRSDVETIAGFDEGPLPARWILELGKRGIEVRRDILRAESCGVLKAFRDARMPLY